MGIQYLDMSYFATPYQTHRDVTAVIHLWHKIEHEVINVPDDRGRVSAVRHVVVVPNELKRHGTFQRFSHETFLCMMTCVRTYLVETLLAVGFRVARLSAAVLVVPDQNLLDDLLLDRVTIFTHRPGYDIDKR